MTVFLSTVRTDCPSGQLDSPVRKRSTYRTSRNAVVVDRCPEVITILLRQLLGNTEDERSATASALRLFYFG